MAQNTELLEIDQDKHLVQAKRHQKTSCDGSIYIIINRDKNGKFASLLIYPPAKKNECGYSWAFAVQDLLTFCLLKAKDEREIKLILKAVSGHYCNAMPANKSHCKSCIDAVAQVLKEELFKDA